MQCQEHTVYTESSSELHCVSSCVNVPRVSIPIPEQSLLLQEMRIVCSMCQSTVHEHLANHRSHKSLPVRMQVTLVAVTATQFANTLIHPNHQLPLMP